MDSKKPSPSESGADEGRRQPYQKPRLQTYGDLSEITKGRLGTKTNDGAGHPNRHFTS